VTASCSDDFQDPRAHSNFIQARDRPADLNESNLICPVAKWVFGSRQSPVQCNRLRPGPHVNCTEDPDPPNGWSEHRGAYSGSRSPPIVAVRF
jgi:hypothetical protein